MAKEKLTVTDIYNLALSMGGCADGLRWLREMMQKDPELPFHKLWRKCYNHQWMDWFMFSMYNYGSKKHERTVDYEYEEMVTAPFNAAEDCNCEMCRVYHRLSIHDPVPTQNRVMRQWRHQAALYRRAIDFQKVKRMVREEMRYRRLKPARADAA